jgi:hypothetical protein
LQVVTAYKCVKICHYMCFISSHSLFRSFLGFCSCSELRDASCFCSWPHRAHRSPVGKHCLHMGCVKKCGYCHVRGVCSRRRRCGRWAAGGRWQQAAANTKHKIPPMLYDGDGATGWLKDMFNCCALSVGISNGSRPMPDNLLFLVLRCLVRRFMRVEVPPTQP